MKHAYLLSMLVTTALASAISVAWATPRDFAKAGSAPQAQASALPAPCTIAPGSRNIPAAVSLQMIGLTADGRLVCFRQRSPQQSTSIGFVSGLVTDTALVGMDYRVQDGSLYAVGNAGGVYTLNTSNASATLVNRLSVPLDGSAFGVDFNPAADRLRVVSNAGQNLRHNVNSGGVTLIDTTLAYTPGTPASNVVGAAYTNNDLVTNTSTTVLDIDTALDQIVLQSPANSGTLAATGKLTFDVQPGVGMDIYSTLNGGTAVANKAFAVLTPVGGTAGLYNIELTTGRATLINTFLSGDTVVDLAIPLDQR